MKRASPFPPYQNARSARSASRTAMGAVDFLRAHDKLAALLPTAARIAALQNDCAAILPEMFTACEVLQFGSDQLVLSVPSTALAAKLKQTLPRLRESLLKRGWQVSSIRLKVQVRQVADFTKREKSIALSGTALDALSSLESTLEPRPQNAALRDALRNMLQRHGAAKNGG